MPLRRASGYLVHEYNHLQCYSNKQWLSVYYIVVERADDFKLPLLTTSRRLGLRVKSASVRPTPKVDPEPLIENMDKHIIVCCLGVILMA